MRIFRLENKVQRYAWGSVDGLTAALGIPNPDKKPQAELWMGAHPGGPSSIITDKGKIGLDAFIAADPVAALGADAARRFGNTLPFLFKGLSAGQPLSIQIHPDKATAELGFTRENALGIPLDAPGRTYRDDNHKPEMTVALTRFEGLCGFGSVDRIIRNLGLVLSPDSAATLTAPLTLKPASEGGTGLKSFMVGLLGLGDEARERILAEARAGVARLLATVGAGPGAGENGAFEWTRKLLDLYPGDIGALMPLVLNLVVMEPGEAIFIGAGVMHAYLEGTALEIMANSDNVIRGGLTSKHIDREELLRVLRFDSGRPEIETASSGEFAVHTPEFALSRIAPEGGKRLKIVPRGPEILLCAGGEVEIAEAAAESAPLSLSKGQSVFVCADCPEYTVGGSGILFRASVPSGEAAKEAAGATER